MYHYKHGTLHINHCTHTTPNTSGIADETFFYTVTEKKFSTHIVAVKLTINMEDFTIKSLYTQEERRR